MQTISHNTISIGRSTINISYMTIKISHQYLMAENISCTSSEKKCSLIQKFHILTIVITAIKLPIAVTEKISHGTNKVTLGSLYISRNG